MKKFLIQQLQPCNTWLCMALTSRASEQWLGQCWTPSSSRELPTISQDPSTHTTLRVTKCFDPWKFLIGREKNPKKATIPNFAVSFTNPEALGMLCWRPSIPTCAVPSWPGCPRSCRRSKLQRSPPCEQPEIQPGWQQTSLTRFPKLLGFLPIWQWFLGAF